MLGMLLSVPLTDLVPMLGLPALTAPFVLATWLVLALGWLEGRLFPEPASRIVTVTPPRPATHDSSSILDPTLGVLPMHLSPQERDKLLIFVAAQVARARKERGLKLNVPEAMALITAELMEMARDGKSVAEIMSAGREILGRRRRHGGRRRDGLHDPGRADLPRRQQAGHGPRSDPLTIGAGFSIPATPGRHEHDSGRILL